MEDIEKRIGKDGEVHETFCHNEVDIIPGEDVAKVIMEAENHLRKLKAVLLGDIGGEVQDLWNKANPEITYESKNVNYFDIDEVYGFLTFVYGTLQLCHSSFAGRALNFSSNEAVSVVILEAEMSLGKLRQMLLGGDIGYELQTLWNKANPDKKRDGRRPLN